MPRPVDALRLLRGHSWRLWGLGVLAAIAMLMPSIIVVAAISIVGIPIAVFLAAAPFLFLVALGTSIISRGLGGSAPAIAAGVAITLALLAIPPLLVNRSLESRARSFVAEDRDDGTKPSGDVIAVRSEKMTSYRRSVVNCDGLCQRALMNGVAKRFLVLRQDINLAIDPAAEADSFRIERRETCPQVELPRGEDPIKHESKDRSDQHVDELMQLEIAKGNCLIAEKAPLGMADTILSVGSVHRGETAVSAGLSLFADTVSAQRIAVHEKRGAIYQETFRRTSVVLYKLWPLYVPTVEGGFQLQIARALARSRETTNSSSRDDGKPDWGNFLTERMGYDLALRMGDPSGETRTVLRDAVKRNALDPAAEKVGADFIQGLASRRRIEGEDVLLVQQLMTDDRFPVPSAAWAVVKYASAATPDHFDAIGASMFTRLRASAAGDAAKSVNWYEQASNIDGVIGALPRDTILRHRDDLEWLARQDQLRVLLSRSLRRLSDFGAAGAPTLLWLIDDAQRFRGKRTEDWLNPYLAGMIGLCELGPEGAAMIQPLYDRLESGVVFNRGTNGNLAIKTLIGLGAKPDDVRLHVKPDTSDSRMTPEDVRRNFEQTMSRAQTKPDCSY